MATHYHYHGSPPSQSKSFDIHAQSKPRSCQPDTDSPPRISRLNRSRSSATLKAMNFIDRRTTTATTSTSAHTGEEKKSSWGFKRKMSIFNRRKNTTEVIEGDDVPGCMPTPGLSKKKSFAFSSKAPVKGDERQPRSRTNSLFHLRSHKNSSKMTLTLATTSMSIYSNSTDESSPIGTPQTPTQPRRTMSPPPSLPSPGFSKDNSEFWYTSLMQQFDHLHTDKREIRRSRSFSVFGNRNGDRNRVSWWDLALEDMIPSPGFKFPWQPGFAPDWGEVEEDYGVAIESAGTSLEDDADSVYRACEAMGGTGIVF